MEIYLPIAEVSINIFIILFLSFVVGFLSGIFGVGGGFLMTPFLIFLGIPPTYAVANEANNILASSTSGSLTHWFKNTLDYKMGFMIVLGGIVGTIIGIFTFTYFKEIGKINLIISLSYMYVLATIGTLMLIEGVAEIDRARRKIFLKKKLHSHYWIHGLPFRMKFKKSQLYESAFNTYSFRFNCGIYCINYGGRRSVFTGTSNDLHYWNANKVSSWNVSFCNNICHRFCNNLACF